MKLNGEFEYFEGYSQSKFIRPGFFFHVLVIKKSKNQITYLQ